MLEIGLWASVAPWGLALLSSVWRYPAVLEELVKWAILRYGSASQVKLKMGAVVGLTFGLSESVLYTLNGWSGGQWEVVASRLLLTVPMHILTAAVTAYGMSKRRGAVGVAVAMVLHAWFNYLVK